MSGRGRQVDKRIAQTVSYLLRCPRSSVPEAMRACKYTLDESSHPTLQMAIRRSYAKATGGKLKSPPEIIDKYSAAATTVSPMTNPTYVVGGPPSTRPMTPMPMTPKPKQKLIRKSARGMQKFRINRLAASDHAKRALKRATRLYAQEKDKPGGLSLRQQQRRYATTNLERKSNKRQTNEQ